MANINLVAIAVACLAGFVVAVLVATVVYRRLLAAKEESCTRLLEVNHSNRMMYWHFMNDSSHKISMELFV